MLPDISQLVQQSEERKRKLSAQQGSASLSNLLDADIDKVRLALATHNARMAGLQQGQGVAQDVMQRMVHTQQEHTMDARSQEVSDARPTPQGIVSNEEVEISDAPAAVL